MTLAFFSAGGANNQAGIFIPRTDLPGILTNSELSISEPEITKLSKFIAAFLYKVNSTLVTNRANPSSLQTGLGMDVVKTAPAGTGQNRFSQTFTCTYAQVIDNSLKEITPIPTPTVGDNQGRGELTISEVFPGVSLLTSNDNIPEAGVLIPNSYLVDFGNDSTTDPVSDISSKKWFMAMFRALFDEATVRNTAQSIVSAITAKAQTAVTSAVLPANATAATNPTTGLDPANLAMLDIYSRNVSFTIEYQIDESAQTYDVRVA